MRDRAIHNGLEISIGKYFLWIATHSIGIGTNRTALILNRYGRRWQRIKPHD